MKQIRPKIPYILCSLILLSACFHVILPVGFTESGVITIFFSEIVGIITAGVLFFYIIANHRGISRENKLCLLSVIIFISYCICVYIVRIFTSGLEMKSIAIFESTVVIIAFMFLVMLKIIPAKAALRTITVFSVILGCVSVVLYFYLDRRISYLIVSSHAYRTYISGYLLPLTAYQFCKNPQKFWRICYYLHLGTLVFCGIASGARLNYLFIPAVVAGIVFILKKEKLFSIKWTCIALAAPIIFVFAAAPFNIYMYSTLQRIPGSSFVIERLNIAYTPKHEIEVDMDEFERLYALYMANEIELSGEEIAAFREHSVMLDAETSTETSSLGRFYVWGRSLDDIKLNPLFGVGLRQYAVDYSFDRTVELTPHNFILEYTLAFGVIGLLLFMLMVSLPLLLSLKKIKWRIFSSNASLFMIVSAIFALSGAFFQPYFISPQNMTVLYLVIGIYSALILQENEGKVLDGNIKCCF
jgi:hypothetical protein